MNHHILIIHGIGKATTGYSRELSEGIARQSRVIFRDNANPPPTLIFHEVLWDDVLAREQALLADILRKGFGLAVRGAPSSVWQKIFGVLKRMINTLRTDIAAEYIEDILSYREQSTYQLIHVRVADALKEVAKDPGPASVSIVAHSLGTVIASDFIFDRQKNRERLAGPVVFKNFFTLGSPIALFALRYGGADLFTSPARLEDSSGVWLNIFDKDDPVGYPLKTLNGAYTEAVSQDVWVNTGSFGISHVKYFKHEGVCRLIAERLS